MKHFPQSFSYVNFHRLYDVRDNSTILGIVFKTIEEAKNWEELMVYEPFSLHGAGQDLTFRFTNHHSDYTFQIPAHIDMDSLELHKPFQLLVCLEMPGPKLRPYGAHHRMSPVIWN